MTNVRLGTSTKMNFSAECYLNFPKREIWFKGFSFWVALTYSKDSGERSVEKGITSKLWNIWDAGLCILAKKFKVCKSVHHRTIQINHQPDETVFQFIILTFIYSSTCLGRFPPIIRSSMTAVAASGFTFVSWWQSCCVRGRAGNRLLQSLSSWW